MTTIQISTDLQKELNSHKFFSRETYEEVIWNLIEDHMELTDETKRDIEIAKEQYKRGKYSTLEEVKKELDL